MVKDRVCLRSLRGIRNRMTSAIILAILCVILMGTTMFYGAWYSLSEDGKNRLATTMPLLLMLPRFFGVLGSFTAGVMLLHWGSVEVAVFLSIIGGLWLILVTAEIIYVQRMLRGRKYERIEEEVVTNQSTPIRYRTMSDNALIAYEARKRL